MVTARSAAMAFNRLVDAKFDAQNPRTATRAIPAGQLSNLFVGMFTVVASIAFLLSALMLNPLTAELGPPALCIVLVYSYMKRVTRWSHLVLGIALGVAPAAAWIAVTGSLAPRVLLLSAIVTLWVGGFDVLYACQDVEYDRSAGLFSVPATFGVEGAFTLARVMHIGMVALLFVMLHEFGLGRIALAGVIVVTLLLLYEHSIVSPRNLRRMNAAFFTMNGIISILLFGFVAADVILRQRGIASH
jgi:4-hydroxybenzoate polyprenyltransferase